MRTCRATSSPARSSPPRSSHRLLDRALELKADPTASRVLDDRTVALLFEHPSTRTRTSMEAGIVEMGGHPMVLRANELQLTRGESVRDTALVFSRHAAAIGLRTGSEERLAELAAYATVPVVNLLSPLHHPCQALADLMTLREAFGDLRGPRARLRRGRQQRRALAGDPRHARGARGADRRARRLPAPGGPRRAAHRRPGGGGQRRRRALHRRLGLDGRRRGHGRRSAATALAPYRLDDALLDRGAPGAIALHCLPAHPGEEITEAVLYGERQRIWDQAENRRHAQKALLELLVSTR